MSNNLEKIEMLSVPEKEWERWKVSGFGLLWAGVGARVQGKTLSSPIERARRTLPAGAPHGRCGGICPKSSQWSHHGCWPGRHPPH